MPYPTEHAARIRQPGDFEQGSFRRVNNKFGSGIHAIFGRLKGKTSLDVQAIRFGKTKWTPERAKEWLDKNGYKPVSFEPASSGDGKKQAQREEVFSFKEVPATAMRFGVGEFTVTDANGEDAKSAPLRMKARSGQPINHPYWGKVAHDLKGMRIKGGRVAVDYNHDPKEVIGYLNHFSIANGDLECKGALCPYKDGDRAMEVASKARQGVPYEASIYFGGGDVVVEEVPEGETADVNDYRFEGPGIIFREWPLRGVAVCPYGADQNTATELSERSCIVQVIGPTIVQDGKEFEMTDDAEAAAKAAAVEAEAKAKAEAEVAAKAATVEALKRFTNAFGAKCGAEWFVAGLSFEQAMGKHAAEMVAGNEALAKENAELKAKLAAVATAGAAAPAAASVPPPAGDAPAKTFMQLVEEKQAADKALSITKAMSLVTNEHPEAYALHRKGKK